VPGVAEVHVMWVTVISNMFMLQTNRCWKLVPGVAEVHAMWVTVISNMFMLHHKDAGS
jgi:hypothetical protein